MKIVSVVMLCGAVALLLAAGGPRAVQGEAALGNYYKEVVREQQQAINEMNQNFTELERASEKLIDLGYYVGQHKLPPKTIKITNTVAVKVPVPFPVAIPEPVPFPVAVSKPVPIPVPTLVAVPIADASSAPPTGSTTGGGGVVATVVTPTVATGPLDVTIVTSGAPPSPSATAPHADSHGSPSQTVSEFQEYVHSFPIHSVYDAGDDYNPMEGNRLALAEHTASPTERTVSKSSPSSLQQHLEAYRPRRPGQGPPQTGPLSGAGTAQRHYGVGAGTTAGGAGTGGRYHGGFQVQAAPHSAAQFGPEPHALQSSAKSYGRVVGAAASYKHHSPTFARAPHSPYSAAPFYGRVSAPTAPPSAADEEVHGHEPHRGGGGGGLFGGPEYGGGGAAGGEAESYAQFATGSEGAAEVPQTAEIRFGGGESEALQAQIEEAGAQQGPDTALGADGDSGHYDHHHHHQQQHAPAAAARPFQTVRESYPRYEKPDFGHYQHHSVHADARLSGSTGGLAGGTGNGGGGGAGAGASGSGSATSSGGILTESYDHPALGGKPSFAAGAGGSDGGATSAAAAAADTHRYPVPGGRTTYTKVSAAGHHHSHPHHPESRPEAHPDLRHQAHDAGAATAAADGLERWPFYQATKNDPHLTRAELKSYHADAASGGPAVRQWYRDSKESEAGYPAYHHHHHHILVGHHNTYTEHRPVAAHQPRHHKHGKQYSVPSDAHLYPSIGDYHHEHHGGDHGASGGKFHYHFRNVHPYAGSEQHGAAHDTGAVDHHHQQQSGAASEHHYYQSEPQYGGGAAGPDGAAVLTSYDPPASGSTFHFHPDDDTTGDLLAGASEAHEQTAGGH